MEPKSDAKRVAKISHKSNQIQSGKVGVESLGKVGVESLWGFGDLCFNAPLIRAISQRHNTKVDVVVASRCQDALINLPWVGRIFIEEELNHGIVKLRQSGYKHAYQITQNVKFYEFKQRDPHHSLVYTPLLTGKQLGLPLFDQRPIYRPTDVELQIATNYLQSARFRMKSFERPLIAIEAVYQSIQSWATIRDLAAISNKFAKTHHILWLSNKGAPAVRYVDDMLTLTRRECIACLRYVQNFFSVGSGFFCASLALPANLQPPRITCLWKDDLYRYEEPLNQFCWHPNIDWIHNREELDKCLATM